MGISKIVALLATATAGVAVFLKQRLQSRLMLFPILHASLVGYVAAIAAHPELNRPLLLGKTSNGRFPTWATLVFFPYLIPMRAYVRLRRFISREPVFSEVWPGIFLGGWPCSPCDVPPGRPAIVDCTCELPRSSCLAGLPYLCIPTWDTRAPEPLHIDLAVKWAKQNRSQGRPVFVHCAFGHGRSVTVMCALFVALGLAENLEVAEKMLEERRPAIAMNTYQRKSAERWNQMQNKSK